MWLIAGLVLAVLVVLAVAGRWAATRGRRTHRADSYVCHVCDDRDCHCEKPGRQHTDR